MAAVRSIWQTPSAIRGRAIRRARYAPVLLPIPSPARNTARMIEKVYTVGPSKSDNSRVHTTSAPSAHPPDKAMARNTAHTPGAGATPCSAWPAPSPARCGDTAANPAAAKATAPLSAAAAKVAVAVSCTRSR